MIEEIRLKLATLPQSPGCYLMKNNNNQIIYVGKAKNLKKRVSSYFNKSHEGKTMLLVKDIVNFEYIMTTNEKESLILEINLIKKHRPRYNVLLTDDKYYPYIQITNEKHPRLKVVRNAKNKKATHFGPYPDSGAARDTLQLLNKLYPLRKCHKLPKKECLYYHLHQCIAPCIKQIDDKVYQQYIKEIKQFLKGDINHVISDIDSKMIKASDNLMFEQALEYKKLIDSIKITTNKQKVFNDDLKDRDFFGYYELNGYLSIQIMIIRNGILIQRDGDIFIQVDSLQDTFESFIAQYYENNTLPNEIILNKEIDIEQLNNVFEANYRYVSRGKHKEMLELANENAKKLIHSEFEMSNSNDQKINNALNELKEITKLDSVHRIEAFDNSTLQATNSIGAMVVFEDGKPYKSEYRKFKIKDENSKDDLSFMSEVIYRRYFRVIIDSLNKPDLIIVDGGQNQIKVAKDIITKFNLNIKVIGLVKDDKHHTSHIMDDNYQEYQIDKRSDLFFLLTRIQDEVHRYAITYHRKLRSKSLFRSTLDEVEGLGSKRQELLLKHFKSFAKIKESSLSELESLLPKKIALDLFNKLKEDTK